MPHDKITDWNNKETGEDCTYDLPMAVPMHRDEDNLFSINNGSVPRNVSLIFPQKAYVKTNYVKAKYPHWYSRT